MTVKELSQLYWLNKEIEMNQKRLEELRAKKDSLSSPDFSGVSRGGDGTSRVEWLAVEISDLEKLIQKKQQQCILEHKRETAQFYLNLYFIKEKCYRVYFVGK